ncbi:MAG: hypothetical protein U1E65_04805 [Myxococcota bacterium]
MSAADLDITGYELESAEERHRQSPETFPIPSRRERSELGVGARVQLLVLLGGHDESGAFVQCERLWVTIRRREGQGFLGALETAPVTTNALRPGDTIAFGIEHVARILRAGRPASVF